MKVIYTLTADIPTLAGVLSRRYFFFSKLKDREAVADALRAKGYRFKTNIEHIYTVEDTMRAIRQEENFISVYSSVGA